MLWWVVHTSYTGWYYKAAHGPLTRYVKLQVAHAPGMPGTFSPAADFKGYRKLAIPACITARDARAVMHVGIAYLRWRGKRSRHSRRMRTRNFAYLARGPWPSLFPWSGYSWHLFTKNTPSYWYRDSHDKHKTVVKFLYLKGSSF